MRYLVLILVLLLPACGFTPVYGTHADKTTLTHFNDVNIALIPNREGQFLRNALMDRFYKNGIPSGTNYTLRIKPITEKTYNFDITIDSEATRKQLKLTTTMSLIDAKTKKVILKRNLLSIASYNVLQSEFSTIVTEQSARENALNDLARQTEQQLSLHFTQQ